MEDETFVILSNDAKGYGVSRAFFTQCSKRSKIPTIHVIGKNRKTGIEINTYIKPTETTDDDCVLLVPPQSHFMFEGLETVCMTACCSDGYQHLIMIRVKELHKCEIDIRTISISAICKQTKIPHVSEFIQVTDLLNDKHEKIDIGLIDETTKFSVEKFNSPKCCLQSDIVDFRREKIEPYTKRYIVGGDIVFIRNDYALSTPITFTNTSM